MSVVTTQYKTSEKLNTRISLHEKYSANKQGFSNWLVSNYDIREGMRILELGCGTGSLWLGHEDEISKCERLVLTDLSEGMLETAKQNLVDGKKLEYQIADIQNLPFEDDSTVLHMARTTLLMK